ncbi:hypothetical protein R84865_002090 [Carnimonas sp. R-84865]
MQVNQDNEQMLVRRFTVAAFFSDGPLGRRGGCGIADRIAGANDSMRLKGLSNMPASNSRQINEGGVASVIMTAWNMLPLLNPLGTVLCLRATGTSRPREPE